MQSLNALLGVGGKTLFGNDSVLHYGNDLNANFLFPTWIFFPDSPEEKLFMCTSSKTINNASSCKLVA